MDEKSLKLERRRLRYSLDATRDGREKKPPPLTPAQAEVAARWFPLAMSMCRRKLATLPWLDPDTCEAVHDSAIRTLMAAAGAYDESRGLTFRPFLVEKLKWGFCDAIRARVLADRRLRIISLDMLLKGKRDSCVDPSQEWVHYGCHDHYEPKCDPGHPDEDFDDLVKGIGGRERRAIALIYRDGLGLSEAASRMGISTTLAARIRDRALRRLREQRTTA